MIFFKNTPCDDGSVLFQAIEDERCLGQCRLILHENTAVVTEVSYCESAPYVVEGLLRSAYNYAGLKNYYIGKCSAKNINCFLDKMNFQKLNDEYVNDIPTILMGSCCK